MADNGKRIGAGSLRSCKRCHASNLAWTQSAAGKWYLCETFRSQSEVAELYVMATWAAHRCEPATVAAEEWCDYNRGYHPHRVPCMFDRAAALDDVVSA